MFIIQKKQTDSSLKEIESREAGLLREYQVGNLSAAQLATRLEELSRAKSTLLQIPETAPVDMSQIRQQIGRYRELIKEQLMNPSFETKQQILRHLIARILVGNESVRIEGEFPITEDASLQTLSAIASTPSTERMGNCGAIKFEVQAKLALKRRSIKKN